MEKKQKIPMVYGYAICLVTVITFIICVGNMVSSIIDLGDPLHAGFNMQNAPSLASFENYKMDILKAQSGTTVAATFTPDDATLRSMYASARADKIAEQNHTAKRTILVSGLLIVISSILFLLHWRWMRKLPKEQE
jgi:hypothetical protein